MPVDGLSIPALFPLLLVPLPLFPRREKDRDGRKSRVARAKNFSTACISFASATSRSLLRSPTTHTRWLRHYYETFAPTLQLTARYIYIEWRWQREGEKKRVPSPRQRHSLSCARSIYREIKADLHVSPVRAARRASANAPRQPLHPIHLLPVHPPPYPWVSAAVGTYSAGPPEADILPIHIYMYPRHFVYVYIRAPVCIGFSHTVCTYTYTSYTVCFNFAAFGWLEDGCVCVSARPAFFDTRICFLWSDSGEADAADRAREGTKKREMC